MRRRLPFLCWPLSNYPHGVDVTPPSEGLERHLAASKHSIRLQRYWWAARAIEDEAQRLGREIVVVDLGCERGWMKRFVDKTCNAKWIGLDGNLSHPSLAASAYDETRLADFNQQLPVADESADVVVSLHVFEHLVNAEKTATEVARILRPEGLFLVGTPGAIPPIASIRTVMLVDRERRGKNRHWGHLRKFSPASWAQVCKHAKLRVQFITGSHLIRFTGFKLENYKWWIRCNQLWGALFPSWGQEIYVAARKPIGNKAPQSASLSCLWLKFDWVAPLAVVALMGWFGIHLATAPSLHPLADEIATHQDGNDVFKWCAMAGLDKPRAQGNVEQFGMISELEKTFSRYREKGFDLHIVIREEHARDYLLAANGTSLHVADQWSENGQRFLVLSQETNHDSLDVWTNGM